MLQCQIRNTVTFKADLHEQLIKLGLDLQNRSILMYRIKCFGNDTEPHITEDHATITRGIGVDHSTIG